MANKSYYSEESGEPWDVMENRPTMGVCNSYSCSGGRRAANKTVFRNGIIEYRCNRCKYVSQRGQIRPDIGRPWYEEEGDFTGEEDVYGFLQDREARREFGEDSQERKIKSGGHKVGKKRGSQ